MNELTAHIADLVYKYLCNEITPEEEAELLQWRMQSVHNQTLFNKILTEDLLKAEVEKLYEFNIDEAWNRINQKINQYEAASSPKYLVSWQKITSIAAILAVLILGAYWLIKPQAAKQPALVKEKKTIMLDKAPGHAGAILILDNGKQLVLDSTGNGILTVDGNINIIKKDGQLIYANEADNAATLVYNTMVTPRARQYNLTLSDGTKVWLNSGSSLRFPVAFITDERRVEITGEAYFEVAHAALNNGKGRKPFIVQVNKSGSSSGMDIEVLGTHFNINAYDDEENIKTTLLEGKVNIKLNHQQQMELKPGQQAKYAEKKNSGLKIVNDVDLEKTIAWKTGKFEFDDMELQAIMRQISRWYDVDIVYERNPDDEKYGGAISKSVQLSDVLKMLEVNGVRFRLEGARLYVKP